MVGPAGVVVDAHFHAEPAGHGQRGVRRATAVEDVCHKEARPGASPARLIQSLGDEPHAAFVRECNAEERVVRRIQRVADCGEQAEAQGGDSLDLHQAARPRSNTFSLCQRRQSGSGRSTSERGAAIRWPSTA